MYGKNKVVSQGPYRDRCELDTKTIQKIKYTVEKVLKFHNKNPTKFLRLRKYQISDMAVNKVSGIKSDKTFFFL